ncbi:MAG: hypothetical protein HY076_07510 [Candidatus Eisenbacteria bacterium]|uniref:Outer membrane protein beta-barrel domain-containing protein n=1 Tax=Eiseniibacteriota bacterium TaxID=2212470 RepID=A0A9D6L9I3_UNCEI|nr:hypothetical protein [Candidatus Eisenbacteria bacterium]MBI3540105.1 hypothetical protein [Candidatus Eisenbacteria bacterium]
MRIRHAAVPAALLLALAWRVPAASAAAEVHRFSFMLSAIPTQIAASDFNDVIGYVNATQLDPRGLEPLDKIQFSWLFDAEARYFVRQNVAVSFGFGQLKARSHQTYLPGIGKSIDFEAAITSVPVHAGVAYYLAPFNSGDFQARAFLGGGFSSVVYNRASIAVSSYGIAPDPSTSTTGTNDGPGYYGEFGGHMFFASRYSVLLSAYYRSNVVRNLINEQTGLPMLDPSGRPLTLDAGGAGFRMSFGIGL